MNSNKPSEKCIAYLKIKGWVFDKIDLAGHYNFLKNKDILWYDPMDSLWFGIIKDKLNELQQA